VGYQGSWMSTGSGEFEEVSLPGAPAVEWDNLYLLGSFPEYWYEPLQQ
jgi:hypothetical protein